VPFLGGSCMIYDRTLSDGRRFGPHVESPAGVGRGGSGHRLTRNGYCCIMATFSTDLPLQQPQTARDMTSRVFRQGVSFRIHYETAFGERLVVVGGAPELGSWDLSRAFPLSFQRGWWVGQLTISPRPAGGGAVSGDSLETVEYKYVIVNDSAPARWEEGPNRQLLVRSAATGNVCHEVRDAWRVRDSPLRSLHGSVSGVTIALSSLWNIALCGLILGDVVACRAGPSTTCSIWQRIETSSSAVT
jgi:hypothetical protein